MFHVSEPDLLPVHSYETKSGNFIVNSGGGGGGLQNNLLLSFELIM